MSVISFKPDETGKSSLTLEGKEFITFYNDIIRILSKLEYVDACQKLRDRRDKELAKYDDNRQQVIERYLQNTQLRLYKTKYVKVQTNRIPHYGISTTSPSKSVHLCLKGQIVSIRSDILTFLRKIALFIEHYIARYNVKVGQARNRAAIAFITSAGYRFYT